LFIGGCGLPPGRATSGAGGSTATGTAGRGAAGGPPGIDTPNCGEQSTSLIRHPPDILVIQDASGSMNDDIDDQPCSGDTGCGATSKWAQMTPAINQVVMASQAAVNWGLKLFADADDNCGVGPGVAVPVGPANATAIAAAIAGRTNADGGVSNGSRGSPTRLAEAAGAAYLAALTDGNPRFIVLATDGLPSCIPGSGGPGVDDSAGAVAAVEAAFAMGIPTFVVGIATTGMGAADTTLGNMANAGGLPRAGTPSYYPVSSAAELESVLTTAVTTLNSCTFQIGPLPTSDGTTSLATIGVFVDGVPVPRDTSHTSGYDYADATMGWITIYGPSCAAIVAGTVTDVTITFYCEDH
jgi:hypothetical protein